MYDLNDKDCLNRIVKDVYGSENTEYRNAISDQAKISGGELKKFVEAHLKKIFTQTHASFTPSNLNIMRKVTDARARAYIEAPRRILDTETESEFYNEFLADMHSQFPLRTFDFYRNAYRYAALWFTFFTNKKGEREERLVALMPNQFTRVVNENGETEVFVVHLGNGGMDSRTRTSGDGVDNVIQDSADDNNVRTLALWTDSQHTVVHIDENNRVCGTKEIEGNESGVNDLGVIPAAFSQEGDPRNKPLLNPLASQTIEINYLMSVITTAMSTQSFGQYVVKHPAEQLLPDNMFSSMFSATDLPQMGAEYPETTAEFINASPDIQGMINVFEKYVAEVLNEHDVTSGESSSGGQSFTSGFHLALSKMDTNQVIENNQDLYRIVEQELYNICKAYLDKTGVKKLKTEKPIVHFAKPAPSKSVKELLEEIKIKKDLGIITKPEILMMLNPNMTEDQAKAQIDKVKEESMEAVAEFGIPETVEDDANNEE